MCSRRTGISALPRAATLALAQAQGDVLVFLNPDTVVEEGALAQLERAVEDPAVGIAMARLRLLDEPEKLNSSGIEVHVTGIGWAGGFGEPAESISEVREIAAPSGTAMAMRTETFRELGGFAEELFMYLEGLELGWRARLAGYRNVIDPAADVLHEYEYGRNPRKSYYLERNRLVFVLSAYSGRLLFLLSPVLVATELGMVALALKEGWLRDKLAGWGRRPECRARSPPQASDAGAPARARSRARPLPDRNVLSRDASRADGAAGRQPGRERLLVSRQEGALGRIRSSVTSSPGRDRRLARRNVTGSRTPYRGEYHPSSGSKTSPSAWISRKLSAPGARGNVHWSSCATVELTVSRIRSPSSSSSIRRVWVLPGNPWWRPSNEVPSQASFSARARSAMRNRSSVRSSFCSAPSTCECAWKAVERKRFLATGSGGVEEGAGVDRRAARPLQRELERELVVVGVATDARRRRRRRSGQSRRDRRGA